MSAAIDDVSRLGPLWVSELLKSVLTRRNRAAENMLTIIPDGAFAKQHEMVIAAADAMLAASELLAALQEYEAARAMSSYGDTSDFKAAKVEMRQPGNHAWGYICEKHGLGYQSGCICCSDDFTRYQKEKNQQAVHARNDALSNASNAARAAIAKATGVAK